MFDAGRNLIDEFAIAISHEFIPNMTETKRDAVRRIYLQVHKYPQWKEYVFTHTLNNALDFLADAERALFWFRKNYSMLEETYLVQ